MQSAETMLIYSMQPTGTLLDKQEMTLENDKNNQI